MILTAWCGLAALVLILSLAAHVSTFLGIDPIEKGPAVMFIHLAIFPPFGAALYYATKTNLGSAAKDMIWKAAPAVLRWLTGAFFIYMIINFVLFFVLSEGGSPTERNGKYVLMEDLNVIRELTESEFHRHQAYVVRGFSGHWMLFATAALTLLIGVRNLRRQNFTIDAAPPPAPAQIEETVWERLPPEPTTLSAAVVAGCLYVFCVLSSFTGLPILAVIASIPLVIAAILAFRRKRGFAYRSFESVIGCLAVFPNAFFASKLGMLVAEFIYLCIYAGISAAVNYTVGISSPKAGPRQLSNGMPVNHHVYSALLILVMFPLFGLGTFGLSYLAEHVGRLFEVRRRRSDTIRA